MVGKALRGDAAVSKTAERGSSPRTGATRLPFFRAWVYQSPFDMYGTTWCAGFILAPWPIAEQIEGHLIQALLHFHVAWRPWRLPRFEIYSADPAERPIGHNA